MEELLYNFQQSDLEFGKTESRIPYPPLGWASVRLYDETEFRYGPDGGESAVFEQRDYSQSLMLPVYIGRKDLVALGEFLGYNEFNFKDGGLEDQELYTAGLMGGWLRQISPRTQASVFVAPFVTSELGGESPEGVEVYAGGVGLYRKSDTFTWLYGGVYEYSYGDQFLYPYAGFLWLPTPDWSLSFIAPWPSVSYACTDRLMLRAGFVPAGSQWSLREDGQEADLEFGSWNLMAGGEYRLTKTLWLYAGVGMAGFRGFELSSDGDAEMDIDVDSDPVFALSINLRPPGGLTTAR